MPRSLTLPSFHGWTRLVLRVSTTWAATHSASQAICRGDVGKLPVSPIELNPETLDQIIRKMRFLSTDTNRHKKTS